MGDDVDGLLSLLMSIPKSILICKDLNNEILWHNYELNLQFKKPINNNYIGMKLYNFFSKNTIKKIIEHDLEVITSKKAVSRKQELELLTGESDYYIVYKAPCINSDGEVTNLVVNALRIKEANQNIIFNNNFSTEGVRILYKKLQNIDLNFKEPLKEILFLINLLFNKTVDLENEIDINNRLVYQELKSLIKKLLYNCDLVLSINNNINNKIYTTFKKINLRKFIQNIVEERMKNLQITFVSFSLKVSRVLPKMISINFLKTQEILQIIIDFLLKILSENNQTKLICKVNSFNNKDRENSYIVFNFDTINANFTIINENNLKELFLAKDLVKMIKGSIELLNNSKNKLTMIVSLPAIIDRTINN